jgi:hypothetical protein
MHAAGAVSSAGDSTTPADSSSTGTAAESANQPGPAAPGPIAPPEPAPSLTIDWRRAPLNSPVALLAAKGWDIEQLNRVGWATGRVLMQIGSDSVFVSDDALMVGFSLRAGQAGRFVVRLHTGQEVAPAAVTPTTFTFVAPIAITEIESIGAQYGGPQDLATSLVLQLNLFGTVMPLDVPIVLQPMSVPREVVKFGNARAGRELTDHLEANRLHYTQAILRALDAATVAALLARFTYRGLPVGQLVDPQPIAVMANFLVFKMNVATTGEPDDPRWAEEQAAWQSWLVRRGLDRPAPKTEIIPLPSGGLFAEAVLGRYNAAEKMDLTRFWNWQDSPIPISAPEIAPLQAGTRAQSEQITPGQLGAPVLSIQPPTALPDPTGIAAIINAVQSGNMFRDMSGMAQTAALAQAALQASAAGATAVGEQAGQNLKTVMDNNTERMRIAAAVMTGGASGLGGGGGGPGTRSAKNVSEEGARLNFARDLDARSANGARSGPGVGKVADVPSPEFKGSADETALESSREDELFNRQTGGAAEDLATQTVAFAGDDGLATAEDEEVAARRQEKRRRRKRKRALPRDVDVNMTFEVAGDGELGEVFAEVTDTAGKGLFRTQGPDGFLDLRDKETNHHSMFLPTLSTSDDRISFTVKYRHHDRRPNETVGVFAETKPKKFHVNLPPGKSRVAIQIILEKDAKSGVISSTPGNHDADVENFVNANSTRPWRIHALSTDLGGDKLRVTVFFFKPELTIDIHVTELGPDGKPL